MNFERKLFSRRRIAIQLARVATWGAVISTIDVARAETIEERVTQIVVDELGVQSDKVTPNANFVNDLGADSLDLVLLIIQVEKEFKKKIPRNVAQALSTVRDITDYIELGRLPTKLVCK